MTTFIDTLREYNVLHDDLCNAAAEYLRDTLHRPHLKVIDMYPYMDLHGNESGDVCILSKYYDAEVTHVG